MTIGIIFIAFINDVNIAIISVFLNRYRSHNLASPCESALRERAENPLLNGILDSAWTILPFG